VGDKFNNTVKALGSFGSKLVAGGDFTATIGLVIVETAHVAVLESAGWLQLGDGLDGYVNVLMEGVDGSLCAGGAMYQDGTPRFGLALLTQGGSTWTHMLPDLADYITPSTGPVEVRALMAINPGFIVAGAFHYHSGTADGQGLASFSGVPNGLEPMASFNGPVDAIAIDFGIVDAFAMYVAGEFTQQESEAVPYIAHTIATSLGINRPGMDLTMKLHPNPSGQELQISWAEPADGENWIDILDGRGGTVQSQSAKGTSATLDIAALAAGSYYAQIRINGRRQVLPFIKR